jgi:hypothetical protein
MEQRRALQLLASIPFGATEIITLADHGFKRPTLTHRVRAGLATIEHASVDTERSGLAASGSLLLAAARSRMN